ncbi:Crinkler (CRN), partial [Phytophthora megakarya]
MVKLFCAIVGVAGSSFPVNIDENETVGDLKKAIKDQSDGIITCPRSQLQLFLAKKGVGWLPSNELASVQGEEAKTMKGFERVPVTDATWTIKDVLTEMKMPNPQSRQIHVLVVVPDDVSDAE